MDGPVDEVLEAYKEFMEESGERQKKTKKQRREEKLLAMLDE
jgi:hypothetical protein